MSEMIGASHGFEIPFVFGHFDLGEEVNVVWTEENEKARKLLSEQMISYWIEFAATGNPGRGRSGDLPEWKPAPSCMLLDTAAGGGLRMSEVRTTERQILIEALGDERLGDLEARCRAWAELAKNSLRYRDAPMPRGCPDLEPKGS